jgi:hypothetical protein
VAKDELVVAGKTFKYTEGDESELEAFDKATDHLRELRRKAIARIRPAPGSERATPRSYETNITLTPPPAQLKKVS